MRTSPGCFYMHSYLTIEVLTGKEDFAIMNEQDKGLETIGSKGESKEGERGPLSCNKADERSPFLEYEYTFNSEGVNKAFDLLFEEVMRRINQDNLWNQQN